MHAATLGLVSRLVGVVLSFHGEWSEEVIERSGHVGQHVSAAVDGAGGVHVSFYEFTTPSRRRLRYAHRAEGGTWRLETVDEARDAGGINALALDSAGRPWISYLDFDTQTQRVAHWTGTRWLLEAVDPGENGGLHSSLAVDARDEPHLTFYDAANKVLRYAHRRGGHWHVETVDDAGDVGSESALALDRAGVPHVAYRDRTWGAVRYAVRVQGSWRREAVDTRGEVGQGVALDLDPSGRARVGYFGKRPERLFLATRERDGWTRDEVAKLKPGLRVSLSTGAGGTVLAVQPPGASPWVAATDGGAWSLSELSPLPEAAWGVAAVRLSTGAAALCFSALADHSLRCASERPATARNLRR